MAITGEMVNWVPFWFVAGGLAVAWLAGTVTWLAIRGVWKLSKR